MPATGARFRYKHRQGSTSNNSLRAEHPLLVHGMRPNKRSKSGERRVDVAAPQPGRTCKRKDRRKHLGAGVDIDLQCRGRRWSGCCDGEVVRNRAFAPTVVKHSDVERVVAASQPNNLQCEFSLKAYKHKETGYVYEGERVQSVR